MSKQKKAAGKKIEAVTPAEQVTPAMLGGLARAASLTPEQKSAIARKGGVAKRLKGLPKAIRKGNFKEHFGADVDCYVLDDDRHTAVISQRGMAEALGLGQSSGARLPRFLSGSKIAPFVGAELQEKLSKPLIFQWVPPVPSEGPPSVVNGYDVTILIDICKAVMKAQGQLLARQRQIAEQAHIIVGASAKAGITGLVYALTGYDATKEETIAAFKLFVAEEAREYEKEFPDQLYAEWYRLYELPRPERNKPWKFRALTIDHVYTPLAKSNGKILALTRKKKAEGEDPRKKLHQFLSDVGVKALRLHLGRLLGMAESAPDRLEYEARVDRAFGVQLHWTF